MSDEKEIQQPEDELFGEVDSLKLPEGDEKASGDVKKLRQKTGVSLKEAADTNTAENLIDRLQREEKLPESIYSIQLAKFLEFLGRNLGIRIEIENEDTLFPENDRTLRLKTSNLAVFLKRGALASTFLLPMLMTSDALAQQLQPGMELIDESVDVVVNQGHSMFHWEHLLPLLLLLGISTVVAIKLIKKYKKKNGEKQAHESLGKYQEAVKSGDPEAIAAAKKEILIGSMSEMPGDIDGVAGKVSEISPAELKPIFKWKKLVDKAINEAISELEKAMILPEKVSIKSLNKIKEKVLKIFDRHIDNLLKLYEKLAEQWSKAPDGSLLKIQIEFEKKKLKFQLDYIKLMRKKWLVILQGAKNELISKGDYKTLGGEDMISKEILELKKGLDELMDHQGDFSPDEFNSKVAELDAKLVAKAPVSLSEGADVGWDHISFEYGGHFDHTTGIAYTINSNNFFLPLAPNFEMYVWINDDKKIQMNLSHKGAVADFQTLAVSSGGLIIKDTGQKLDEYLAEKESDSEVTGLEASAEITPESGPVLSALSSAILSINQQIKSKNADLFGTKVEADDDAIKYHLMRVHREYHQGKPRTVVRFTLEEGFWKKALSGLSAQPDVPKSTVSFNYENVSGGKMSIDQPMRRFNILIDGKQVTVLVTANEQLKAIAGEVRVIFNPEDDFSAEQLNKVFAEVSKRLGLNDHLKPVSEKAKEKLQKKLKSIRKGSSGASNSTVHVHNEYQAETVEPVDVEDLQKRGLHSIYHQFDLDVLKPMFQSNNLMATSTRWAKGILKSGMSSSKDMQTGGGTEVFMRAHTKKSVKSGNWYNSKPAIVFGPKLMQRMDCYCYASDQYGSKMPGTFDQRISPAQLMDKLDISYNSGHEIMFFDAVSLQDAQYIVYDHPGTIIKQLKEIGIHSIGGKPLKDAVITREQYKSINFS